MSCSTCRNRSFIVLMSWLNSPIAGPFVWCGKPDGDDVTGRGTRMLAVRSSHQANVSARTDVPPSQAAARQVFAFGGAGLPPVRRNVPADYERNPTPAVRPPFRW